MARPPAGAANERDRDLGKHRRPRLRTPSPPAAASLACRREAAQAALRRDPRASTPAPAVGEQAGEAGGRARRGESPRPAASSGGGTAPATDPYAAREVEHSSGEKWGDWGPAGRTAERQHKKRHHGHKKGDGNHRQRRNFERRVGGRCLAILRHGGHGRLVADAMGAVTLEALAKEEGTSASLLERILRGSYKSGQPRFAFEQDIEGHTWVRATGKHTMAVLQTTTMAARPPPSPTRTHRAEGKAAASKRAERDGSGSSSSDESDADKGRGGSTSAAAAGDRKRG